ncbi:MAG: hypothetical protein ACI8ZM_000609 [Crocinitomix sp.]|jgi:hypothetical protein
MRIFVGLLLIGLFVQCSNQYTFKDISKFTISHEELLKDGELVEVIYSSEAPDANADVSYYLHLIVVGPLSKDTFNLLSTSDPSVTNSDRMRYYIANDSDANLILQNLEKLERISSVKDLSPKEIKKVVVNNSTSWKSENSYPTLIGGLVNEIYQN